jgi:hypothetical protein
MEKNNLQVSIGLKNKFARTRSHRWYGIATDVEGYRGEAERVERSPARRRNRALRFQKLRTSSPSGRLRYYKTSLS